MAEPYHAGTGRERGQGLPSPRVRMGRTLEVLLDVERGKSVVSQFHYGSLMALNTPASQKRMAPNRWTCSAPPCGPRASTTRPTSTTTWLPAYATTGQDSTAAWRALRKGDGLVVWKFDRLGRNLAYLVHTVQDLSARGVACGCSPVKARRSTPPPRPAAPCSASSRRWPSSSVR